MDIKKFQGCLLGLAIGDALGMPFEGWRISWIKNKVGKPKNFYPPFDKRDLKAGQWTDDTKMALALAQSIIDMKGKVVPEDIANKYLKWFSTGDLRGIGGATLEAILRLKEGANWQQSGREGFWAAGNGTAMRVAPIGLIDSFDYEKIREDAQKDALITHRNIEAFAGSRAVAFLIAEGVNYKGKIKDLPKEELINKTIEFIGNCELKNSLNKVKNLLLNSTPCEVALRKLGTRGYVVETVSSALYCFLSSAENFEETVINAVLGGGDTDTTAAIAGAISGAWNGIDGIPKRWIQQVEDSAKIIEIASQLFNIFKSVSSKKN